jgi:eukaryotic-like serine/threonine-protein kinase
MNDPRDNGTITASGINSLFYLRTSVGNHTLPLLSMGGYSIAILQDGHQLQNGKYRIKGQPLGQGRFSVTYLAEEAQTGDRWILKTLKLDFIGPLDPGKLQRRQDMLWAEATKLSKCQHPHIVKSRSPFREKGQIYLPMEYIDGRSLAERATTILPESVALEYIRQIGDALKVVHQQNLVHRDVHPGNILLRSKGDKNECVLIDFGLSLEADHSWAHVSNQKRKSEGYTPFELYDTGASGGPYSDIYGLAATLYQLLTGKTPVSAYDRHESGAQLVPPKSYNPKITKWTNKLILDGMALDPKDRPQSVQDWLKILKVDKSLSRTRVKPDVNWTKWGTIWAAVAAIAACLAILQPTISGLFKPASNSIVTPRSSQTP